MSVYRLPHCAVCNRQCIPMADYDVPTCIDCDQAMELIVARAAVVETTMPAQRPPGLQPHGTHAAFNRHRFRGEDPCGDCWRGERTYQRERARRTRARAA